MDRDNEAAVYALIDELREQRNLAVVVISHDMASAFRIGHRVSMLYKGKIIASGPPDRVMLDPPQPLADFINTAV